VEIQRNAEGHLINYSAVNYNCIGGCLSFVIIDVVILCRAQFSTGMGECLWV